MLLKVFKKGIATIKELHEAALFTVMSDADIFLVFKGSPLYFALLPMIGLLATALALSNGLELIKASNKNFDRWFAFLASTFSAVFASVYLYGSVIASYYELNFALGPWFFLASVGVAFTHQFAMLGVNCYRAYEAPSKSVQRMHYVQAALNNVVQLSLITAVAGAVSFTMLTPAAPIIGSICALTGVGMTGIHLLWRVLPSAWRGAIKALFSLDKPKQSEEKVINATNMQVNVNLASEPQIRHQRLFSKRDLSAEIQKDNCEQGLKKIKLVITEKITHYAMQPLPHNEKNQQKKALLSGLFNSLNQELSFSKKDLLKAYPLAFQSFWAEKGEVEQIIDAVYLLKEKERRLSVEADSSLCSVRCL